MTNNEKWNDFYKQIVTINNQLVAIITPHSRGVLLTQKKSCIKLKIGRQREIMAPLSSSRPTPVYDCKQNELYSVALIGWKSFELNQAAFEAFNTRYTVAFGTTMKAAVVSAKQLPDEFQRSDEHKTLRINLKNKANDVLIKWQQLESFINNGFPEEELESKKQAAGHAYYRDAANDDWESVDSLLTDASAFVAGYAAELTTGGMPALFAPDFATLKTEFEVLYSDFTNAEQQAPEQTDAKIAANNLVYKNLLPRRGSSRGWPRRARRPRPDPASCVSDGPDRAPHGAARRRLAPWCRAAAGGRPTCRRHKAAATGDRGAARPP